MYLYREINSYKMFYIKDLILKINNKEGLRIFCIKNFVDLL